jgi:phage repressor protein C with HTH and peptisase S24 domain
MSASLTPQDIAALGSEERLKFRNRLNLLVSKHRSVSAFARSCGVSDSVVRKWLDGISDPSREYIVAVAQACGVSVGWLAAGEDVIERDRVSQRGLSDAAQADFLTRNDQDFVLIPRYDVTASAGAGAIIESDKLLDFLAFRTDWIRRTLALDPKRLAVISAEGDSMRPTIAEGDVLLVDTDIHHVRDSAIYVLQLSGVLLVKRVRIRLDGGVDVISDNAAYPPETVPARDLDRLVIAGRVVWHGGLV